MSASRIHEFPMSSKLTDPPESSRAGAEILLHHSRSGPHSGSGDHDLVARRGRECRELRRGDTHCQYTGGSSGVAEVYVPEDLIRFIKGPGRSASLLVHDAGYRATPDQPPGASATEEGAIQPLPTEACNDEADVDRPLAPDAVSLSDLDFLGDSDQPLNTPGRVGEAPETSYPYDNRASDDLD